VAVLRRFLFGWLATALVDNVKLGKFVKPNLLLKKVWRETLFNTPLCPYLSIHPKESLLVIA
jgi:hypothetical protein